MSEYILYRVDDDVLSIPIEAISTEKQRKWLESGRHGGYDPKLNALAVLAYKEFCNRTGRVTFTKDRFVLKRNRFQYWMRDTLTRLRVI